MKLLRHFVIFLLIDRVYAAGNDWMRDLDGKRRLSELSIPGTHNAGATLEPIPGTACCQSLSIAEQLAAGVRFLDIRCRHLNDSFSIYHGIADQKLTFAIYTAKNPALWSLGEDIPTLAAARGRIVLFRRFRASSKLGIDASGWPDSATFTSGKIRVQDCYQVASTCSISSHVFSIESVAPKRPAISFARAFTVLLFSSVSNSSAMRLALKCLG